MAAVHPWHRLALPQPDLDPGFNHLTEIHEFGSNPGALRMFTYVPARTNSTLVVVLHGCAQTAASYDVGAGWSTLADRYGFALLLPQQQASNNAKQGFNWFVSRDIERGKGEALSIRQMIETMIIAHGINRKRVFVTGLSAGGAMACVMLATYPELFAGGAVIAGLPFRTATNLNEAFESMYRVRGRPAAEWGDLVRAASPHRGPWPRMSVWHGGADTVVSPDNADEIVKQWVDVHGLDHDPAVVETVDGYPRQVWRNRAGDDVVESYTIPGMAHGTPLASGGADTHCGSPGAYLLDVGISSSYHIAKFWGLTGHRHKRGRSFIAGSRNLCSQANRDGARDVAANEKPQSGRHEHSRIRPFGLPFLTRLVNRFRKAPAARSQEARSQEAGKS